MSTTKQQIVSVIGLSLFLLHGCNKPHSPKTSAAEILNYNDEHGVEITQNEYECEKLIQQKHYQEAYTGCLHKAQNGDTEAQVMLANLYFDGRLGSVDWDQGVNWILKAAEQGHPQAQFLLAKRYENGEGLKKDEALAFKWLTHAAKANYLPAQALLGEFYLEGKGTPKDFNLARQWLINAAQMGDANAQYLLGKIYIEGQGVNKNVYLGERYLIQAAEQNVLPAQLEVANLYQEGTLIARNEAVAYKWYLAAAEQGEPQSMTVVGMSLITGSKDQQNIEKGTSYLTKAADIGYYPAQYALASLYLDGHPVLKDKFVAIEYLRKAAVGGSTDAQIKLARLLVEFSLPQYDKVAFYWMSQAASKDMDAQYQLGCYYVDGIGTEIDYDRAFQIFNQLAAQNHHESQMKLGQMHYYGQGVDKDNEVAKKWFIRAATGGVEDAKNWVAILFRDGIDVTQDSETQVEINQWIQSAADKGEPQAIYIKGMNHLYGRNNFAQNVDLGVELIELAAANGFVPAQRELGIVYEQGLFGLKGTEKAYQWYLKASENGDDFAQYRLAHMYFVGDGVPKNDIQSYAWASLAAMSGKTEATALRDEISLTLKSNDLEKAREISEKYFAQHKKTAQNYAMPISMGIQ